jgi:hypothetical protein
MKTKLLTLLVGLALPIFTFGIHAADIDDPSDKKKTDGAKKVQPHSHPSDAKTNPTSSPKKPEPVKDEVVNERAHSHPKDGK